MSSSASARLPPMAYATATIMRARPAAGPASSSRGRCRSASATRTAGLTPTVSIASCDR